MEFANRLERSIPPKIRRRTKTRDRVVVGVCVIDHDIRSIVDFVLGGKILIQDQSVRHWTCAERGLTVRIAI